MTPIREMHTRLQRLQTCSMDAAWAPATFATLSAGVYPRRS